MYKGCGFVDRYCIPASASCSYVLLSRTGDKPLHAEMQNSTSCAVSFGAFLCCTLFICVYSQEYTLFLLRSQEDKNNISLRCSVYSAGEVLFFLNSSIILFGEIVNQSLSFTMNQSIEGEYSCGEARGSRSPSIPIIGWLNIQQLDTGNDGL